MNGFGPLSKYLHYITNIIDEYLQGRDGINYSRGRISIDDTVALQSDVSWLSGEIPQNTDELDEGTSNLYFTTGRVDSHLSGGTGINYSSGTISIDSSQISIDYVSNIADGSESGYRVSADSFHTNGLGQGQIYIEGSRIDANTTIYIGDGKAGGQSAQNVVFGGDITASTLNGTATSAQYSDLAEKYFCNQKLPTGTVVKISNLDNNEICPSTKLSKTAIGVISENPAYLMNKKLKNGMSVGLTGRLPVYINGKIKKGDFIVPDNNGTAKKGKFWQYKYKMGIALETNNDKNIKLVECFIK